MSQLTQVISVQSELPGRQLPWFNIDFSLSMIGWTEYL